jgi:hypothetical protein
MPNKIGNNFITDVIIRGTIYELWSLPNKVPHSTCESGCLWVKRKETSTFDNAFDEEWYPWLDSIANRDCWKISIKDGNSIKQKDGNYIINKHTTSIITLNGKDIYEINGINFDFCYNEARNKIYQLKNLMYIFGVNLKDTSKEKNRKIFYKSMPAIIDIIYVYGTVHIIPDCDENDKEYWWNQITEPWYNDYDIKDWESNKQHNGIKVDILSHDIYWNRNDRQIKLNKIKRTTNEERIT